MSAESPCSSYETDQGSTSTLRPRLLPRKRKPTCFRKMVRYIAKKYLTSESDRQYYADRYTCCPPPLFVPTVTLAEVGGLTFLILIMLNFYQRLYVSQGSKRLKMTLSLSDAWGFAYFKRDAHEWSSTA